MCATSSPQADHPQQCATPQSYTVHGVKTRSMSKGEPEVTRSNEVHAHTPLNPDTTPFIMPASYTPDDNAEDFDIDTSLSSEIPTPVIISLCDQGLRQLECSAIQMFKKLMKVLPALKLLDLLLNPVLLCVIKY